MPTDILVVDDKPDRFRNALCVMQEAYPHWDENLDFSPEDVARMHLIRLCLQIAKDYQEKYG